jgi:hydrogenase nickel incorporation protein HypA/HybF
MHELSIALSLVETAESAARDAGAVRVDVVYLRLGLFAGVVKDALHFSWDVATEDTLLSGARLEIEDVPVVIHCPTCDADRTLPNIQLFQCPVCGTPTPDIRQGRELELTSIEIVAEEDLQDDETAPA